MAGLAEKRLLFWRAFQRHVVSLDTPGSFRLASVRIAASGPHVALDASLRTGPVSGSSDTGSRGRAGGAGWCGAGGPDGDVLLRRCLELYARVCVDTAGHLAGLRSDAKAATAVDAGSGRVLAAGRHRHSMAVLADVK